MRIGPDDGVGIRERPIGRGLAGAAGTEDDPRQILDIDLVDDARVGRHGAEIGQRFLPPLEECVALTVSLELEPCIFLERAGRREGVDLHGMVDD